jgi:xylan 1,4-beta-xylosidase
VVHVAPPGDARLAHPHCPPLPPPTARRPLPAEHGRAQSGGPSGAVPRGAFEATIEYRPRSFQHLAGITAYYNTRNWYFLHVTADDQGQAVLRVACCDRGALSVDEAEGIPLGKTRVLRLGLDLEGPVLRFRYDTGEGWSTLGPPLDATVLSDEHAEEFEDGRIRSLGFTGAFVGLWAWDLAGGGLAADFDDAAWSERARKTG